MRLRRSGCLPMVVNVKLARVDGGSEEDMGGRKYKEPGLVSKMSQYATPCRRLRPHLHQIPHHLCPCAAASSA